MKQRIAMVGAGAIGGWVGAALAAAGHDVAFVARGSTLSALQQRGIGLSQDGETRFFPCRASADPTDLGTCDMVIIAVKAHALPALAPRLTPLIGPDTVVLPMLNGVPWWFMGAERPLYSVDPSGTIAASLPRSALIGCVVHAAVNVPEPGISKLHFCDKLIIGEAEGGQSPRLEAAADLLATARLAVEHSPDIRTAIWFKLWGNMTMNPMSALTLATMDRLLDDPYVRELALAAMAEAQELGARIGCPIDQSGQQRMEVTHKLGAFKTSMLQDVEAGRTLELDALLSAPIEIAEAEGVPVPVLRGLLGLVRTMARSRGLY